MTWYRLVTVPTPEQLDCRDEEQRADRDPGDRRLRGATREQIERAERAADELCQVHLSRFQEDR